MKILHKQPWFFPIFKYFFPGLGSKSIITFGDTIYSPDTMLDDVLEHEKIHIKQQKGSKIYAFFFAIVFIVSPKFRLKTELEAFRHQYKICPDRLDWAARTLSGPGYGNIVTYEQAIALIRHDRAVHKLNHNTFFKFYKTEL